MGVYIYIHRFTEGIDQVNLKSWQKAHRSFSCDEFSDYYRTDGLFPVSNFVFSGAGRGAIEPSGWLLLQRVSYCCPRLLFHYLSPPGLHYTSLLRHKMPSCFKVRKIVLFATLACHTMPLIFLSSHSAALFC